MNSGRIGNVLDTDQFGGGDMVIWCWGFCDYGATRIRASSAVP